MDLTTLAVFVASMLVVGLLARERDRSPWPWVITASIIGPFAIPMLYLVVAISALRKMKAVRS
jgi:hypothetical protein